jgi:hypothetical protein
MTHPHYPPKQDRPPDVEGDDEGEAPPPPDPDTLRGMFENPATRNYLFAGFAALAMVFVVMLQQASDVGGLMLVLLGAAGMVLRWPAAPVLFLLLLFWFLIFPFGIPDPDSMPLEFDAGSLRVADMLLVFSVVVYLASHYRVYGLTTQAVPFDQRFPRKKEKPLRRPTDLVGDGELPRLLYLTGGVVLAGQLAWVFVTSFEVDVLADFPLRLVEGRRAFGERSAGMTRFILTTGLLFFGTLLARLVFGYWRLRRMTPAEGGMILQDANWDETRRERVRVERWRNWAKTKEKADGPEAGDAR